VSRKASPAICVKKIRHAQGRGMADTVCVPREERKFALSATSQEREAGEADQQGDGGFGDDL